MRLFLSVSLLVFCVAPLNDLAQSSPGPLPAVADHHLHLRSEVATAVLTAVRVALDSEDQDEVLAAIDVEAVLEAMDNAGIQQGLILSNAYMIGMPDINPEGELPDVQAENNFIATQASLSGGRLVALCSVNPLADYSIAETRRCKEELDLGGLKLHLANSDVDLFNAEHVAKLQALFRYLEQANFPVLAHIRTRNEAYGAEDAAVFIDEILSQAPSISVQIAHMAGWGGYDDATDAALGEFIDAFASGRLAAGRVQFDLAAVVFNPALGDTEAVRERVAGNNRRLSERITVLRPDQVLFASDWSSWPPLVAPEDKIRRYVESLEPLLSISTERMGEIMAARGAILD